MHPAAGCVQPVLSAGFKIQVCAIRKNCTRIARKIAQPAALDKPHFFGPFPFLCNLCNFFRKNIPEEREEGEWKNKSGKIIAQIARIPDHTSILSEESSDGRLCNFLCNYRIVHRESHRIAQGPLMARGCPLEPGVQ